MKHRVRVVDTQALMEQLPQMLLEAESVPLVISGNSMAPFLVHGRDIVYLSKVTQPLKRGDMILYQRGSGVYVLHRIYRERNGSYDLVGDGQVGLEPGIRREQVFAIVKAVRRNGELLRKGSLCWEFFEHTWLTLLPFRFAISGLYCRIKAWRKRK